MTEPNKPHLITKAPIAIMDLGSNSFHLLIIELSGLGFKQLYHQREVVRLRAGLEDSGNLSASAIDRALTALGLFHEKIQAHGVSQVIALGTATFRMAKNKEFIQQQIENQFGFHLEIITGAQEAEYIYQGIYHQEQSRMQDGVQFVVDIGGGSTECIIGQKEKIIKAASVNIGCVELLEQFFPGGQISASTFKDAIEYTQDKLITLLKNFKQPIETAFASSGVSEVIATYIASNEDPTKITIAGLDNAIASLISIGHISNIQSTLSNDRKALLPAGLVILRTLLDMLGVMEIWVSQAALREGVIAMLNKAHHVADSPILMSA